MKKIIIHDSCIEDTLKIRWKVEIIFEHSLVDTIQPMAVKSIKLISVYVGSVNPPRIIANISYWDSIDIPFHQYIWDLCSAKVSYWYRYQPYGTLPLGDRKNAGNRLYMTAVVYMVPNFFLPIIY